MPPIKDIIANNPWKAAFAMVSPILGVVAALFTVDYRYAHRADVKAKDAQTEKSIIDSASKIRRDQLEDKLWELDIKKELSPNEKLGPADAAFKKKYERELRIERKYNDQ